MTWYQLLIFTSFCLVSLADLPAAKTSSDAKVIVTEGENRLRGSSSQATMRMLITRPSYRRELVLRSWARGSDKALVEILEPAKEEGVASLRVETQMWNYLPKTDQIVRVPSSLMLQSWMGSDFTNDDLMKASSLSRDYKHKILKFEKDKNGSLVLIECSPLPGAPVVWGKILHWARTQDNLPARQQFFDDQGKLVRTIHFKNYKKMDDRIIPTEIEIVKAENQESTTVFYDRIVFNRNIPDRVFDKDQIRTLSQKGKVISAGWFLK